MTDAPAIAADVARWLRGVLPAGGRLVADSRGVARGDAFFAYPGGRADGRRHVAQAIERGAAALVVEADSHGESGPVSASAGAAAPTAGAAPASAIFERM